MEWKVGDKVRVKSVDEINWDTSQPLNSEAIKRFEGVEGIIEKINTKSNARNKYKVKLASKSKINQFVSEETMNAVFEKVNLLPEELFEI